MMNRRTFLEKSTQASLALTAASLASPPTLKKGMGVAAASYAIRWHSNAESKTYPAFIHALHMLEHCYSIGAAGIQTGIGQWTEAFAGKVRDKREELDLYLEGQILLPENQTDLDRFEKEVVQAKEAGVSILRTVCLRGRRYETFDSLKAFQDFHRRSILSLQLAEPIMRKHKIKLAIENHKDWRIPEMLKLMKQFESEWIGITLDTGNNLSLLEDPMEVVEAFAPYTQSIHFKDMAYEEYEEGFLLSEVPLGQGVLDLQKIRSICERHNPQVNFNLEMITRNPLKVPCLNKSYWETFEHIPAQDLAQTLHNVRTYKHPEALPRLKDRNSEQALVLEEENIKASFDYAKKSLGFL